MRRNNWKCTFESLGKAYAFGVNYLVYRYLVKILRKKTRKFTCNSSKRKDSGNVIEQFLVARWEKSDQLEKWETNSPRKSDHSSLDATTTKEGQIPWSQVQLNWNNGSKLIYSKWNMCREVRMRTERSNHIDSSDKGILQLFEFQL